MARVNVTDLRASIQILKQAQKRFIILKMLSLFSIQKEPKATVINFILHTEAKNLTRIYVENLIHRIFHLRHQVTPWNYVHHFTTVSSLFEDKTNTFLCEIMKIFYSEVEDVPHRVLFVHQTCSFFKLFFRQRLLLGYEKICSHFLPACVNV